MRVLSWFLCLATVFFSFGSSQDQDVERFVDLHNEWRDKVKRGEVQGQPCAENMPPVVWDEELAAKAQEWAKKCIQGHDDRKDRATKKFPKVGQNWAGGHNLEAAFMAWFNEYQHYDLASQKCSKVCGHYTQIVTADSTSIGCAYAACPNQPWRHAYVCNYGPAGNMRMKYPNGTIVSIPPYKATEQCQGADPNDPKQFLDLHNDARKRVKEGKVPGQPCAESMPPLMWDEELAQKAKTWAKKCDILPQKSSERVTTKFSYFGQNWAGAYRSAKEAFEAWFDEYTLYTFNNRTCERFCGHYEEIVSANTTHIGCAIDECPNEIWNPVYVCNYGPGAPSIESGLPVYKASPTCSGSNQLN